MSSGSEKLRVVHVGDVVTITGTITMIQQMTTTDGSDCRCTVRVPKASNDDMDTFLILNVQQLDHPKEQEV